MAPRLPVDRAGGQNRRRVPQCGLHRRRRRRAENSSPEFLDHRAQLFPRLLSAGLPGDAEDPERQDRVHRGTRPALCQRRGECDQAGHPRCRRQSRVRLHLRRRFQRCAESPAGHRGVDSQGRGCDLERPEHGQLRNVSRGHGGKEARVRGHHLHRQEVPGAGAVPDFGPVQFQTAS